MLKVSRSDMSRTMNRSDMSRTMNRSDMSRTILKYKNKAGIYYNVPKNMKKIWYNTCKIRNKTIKEYYGCEFEELEIKESFFGDFVRPLRYEWEEITEVPKKTLKTDILDFWCKTNNWKGHVNEYLLIYFTRQAEFTHDETHRQNFEKILQQLKNTKKKINSLEKWEDFLFDNREEISSKGLGIHYCMFTSERLSYIGIKYKALSEYIANQHIILP